MQINFKEKSMTFDAPLSVFDAAAAAELVTRAHIAARVNGKVVGSGDVFGLICGIMSAVTYAFMITFKKLSAEIDGIESTMLQLIAAFITVATFVGITQGYAIEVPRASIPAILILGIVNTGIVSYMYFSSMGKLPVQSVAVLGYIEPLSAVFFSVLFLHEVLLPMQLVGGVLIIGGAAAAELLGRGKTIAN